MKAKIKPVAALEKGDPAPLLKAQILGRIDSRLRVIGMDPATASQAAGFGPDLIRDLNRKEKAMPRIESLVGLAPVLKTTPEWLAFGRSPETTDDVDNLVPAIRVPIISWVAASRFSEVYEVNYSLDAPIRYETNLPAGSYIALAVRGDSMDRVAPEASVIIVNLLERELVSRRLYVVSNGGDTTFKRWMANPDRLEPMSTNPEHESIAPSENHRVIGRVVRVHRDL